MSIQEYTQFGNMKMFLHHIYELKKGIRNLVLCTMCKTCAEIMTERLRKQNIAYFLQEVAENKVNLFFGKQAYLDTVRLFTHKPLNLLTPEEDFILGVLLGYDMSIQCERFCNKKNKN
ncbi:MAG: DUF2023 family protein [Bacteroidales bacterium]|nr:DUF2023 family protein [Bacteroidales bacterium]